MFIQHQINIQTKARSTINVTREIEQAIAQSAITTGLCHIFIRHTSASLIVTENADPSVRRDLEYFMTREVRDGDPQYQHDMEGPDDMSAHIRTVLTQTELTIPIVQGRAGLGTWQGVFVWEHRTHAHRRQLILTLQGE
jgi:secondary thiamine-phosphate synthase enzyme